MIDYFQIQRIASQKEIPEEIIEKDYLIELLLFYIGKDNYFKKTIVFRGGTALKKVYFPEYRFSEDLDFLVEEKEELKEYEQRVDQILTKITYDYPFQLNKVTRFNKERLQIFISYDIVTEIRGVKELKVDILKDDFIPAFQKKKIQFTYPEFKKEHVELNTYILEAIASDKISRILGVDKEVRDIYDLWYLLNLELDFSKIKSEFRKKFGFEIHFSNLLNEITLPVFKRNWRIRLERQVKNLPSYEIVVKELKELIENKLIKS